MREDAILSPSQVGQYLKNMMDRDHLLSRLLVRGELSNYKMYPSGHHYFTPGPLHPGHQLDALGR